MLEARRLAANRSNAEDQQYGDDGKELVNDVPDPPPVVEYTVEAAEGDY